MDREKRSRARKRCRMCNRVLTREELNYYECFCTDCERMITRYTNEEISYIGYIVRCYWRRLLHELNLK